MSYKRTSLLTPDELLERRRYKRIWQRKDYVKNRIKILARNRLCRLNNIDEVRRLSREVYQKKYRELHRDRVLVSSRRWAMANKEKSVLWRKNNVEKVRAAQKRYKKSSPEIILRENMRARLVIALKTQHLKKTVSTSDLIGCTIPELRDYLADKFKPGMSWGNWGFYTWHIDHIKPLSLFDLSDPKQQKEAFHYSNLQPLWAKENLSKHNKYGL